MEDQNGEKRFSKDNELGEKRERLKCKSCVRESFKKLGVKKVHSKSFKYFKLNFYYERKSFELPTRVRLHEKNEKNGKDRTSLFF